jgi:hypothetical protein
MYPATRHSVLPEHIARLVGKPPVLSSESEEEFWSLLERFATSREPQDSIEWFAVWSYIVKTWELLRYYKARAAMIDSARPQVVEWILEWIAAHPGCDRTQDEVRKLAAGVFNTPGKAKEELMAFLATFGIGEDAITAECIASRLPELERIDRMIAMAEFARNGILREMLFYRGEFVERFRLPSTAVPSDFEKLPPPAHAMNASR